MNIENSISNGDITVIINKDNATRKKEYFDTSYDNSNKFEEKIKKIGKKITTGLAINITCDYCHGSIFGQPRVLKFADLERFFCCNSCKTDYSEKYRGRIESIKRRYEGKSEIEI